MEMLLATCQLILMQWRYTCFITYASQLLGIVSRSGRSSIGCPSLKSGPTVTWRRIISSKHPFHLIRRIPFTMMRSVFSVYSSLLARNVTANIVSWICIHSQGNYHKAKPWHFAMLVFTISTVAILCWFAMRRSVDRLILHLQYIYINVQTCIMFSSICNGINNFSVLMCRKTATQSINQSINQSLQVDVVDMKSITHHSTSTSIYLCYKRKRGVCDMKRAYHVTYFRLTYAKCTS